MKNTILNVHPTTSTPTATTTTTDLQHQLYLTMKSNLQDQVDDPELIVEVVRVTTKQQHRLDYMKQIIMMRENDKLDSSSEANFKYQNKNDIEDMYYLFQNKKVKLRENK
ncbi:hypothetical protein Tco_1441157 [Tanacetum coccineum]